MEKANTEKSYAIVRQPIFDRKKPALVSDMLLYFGNLIETHLPE